LKRALDIGSQNLDGSRDSGSAGSCKAVGIGAPDKNGSGAQTNGFDYVSAAADSAIHQHFNPAVHRSYHLR
jgi:hypothetical protein